ncbi:MAG: hypothetical protein HUJ54_12500 [Erysipelotrichaceae bacterium]|nr:hypothetical protein [Erysipelotrichaceae bacterium]
MKNRKIRRALAASMAGLSVFCSPALPGFAQESAEMTADAEGQSELSSLNSGLSRELSADDCGEKVGKYNIWKNCEYILRSGGGEGIKYSPVRVIDRYEEYYKVLWIFTFSQTKADLLNLDTGKEFSVYCDAVSFYYPKEPFE